MSINVEHINNLKGNLVIMFNLRQLKILRIPGFLGLGPILSQISRTKKKDQNDNQIAPQHHKCPACHCLCSPWSSLLFLCVCPTLLCLCVVFAMLTMALPPLKRRWIVLSLEKKWENIQKMEAGWTIFHLAQTYDVPNNTLYDLKNKERIMQ